MGRGHLTDNVTNVVVEAIKLLHKNVRLAVRVVVAKNILGVVKGDAVFWIGSGGRRNDLNIGVRSLDCLVEEGKAVLAVRVPATRIAGEPILVTDFDVVEGEWLRVSEFGTTLAPG